MDDIYPLCSEGCYWWCEHRSEPQPRSSKTIGLRPVEEAMDKSRLVSLYDTSFMGSSYNRATDEWEEDVDYGSPE